MTRSESSTNSKLTRAQTEHLAQSGPTPDAPLTEIWTWTIAMSDTLPDLPDTREKLACRLAGFLNVYDPDELVSRIFDGRGTLTSALPRPTPVLDLPDDEPVETLIDGLIYRGDQNLILGRSGAWKSTYTLLNLCAITAGVPLLGELETQTGPCLYVSEEDPQSRIRMRVFAIARGLHLNFDKLGNLQVLARKGAKLEDVGWQQHLLDVVRDLGCVCVAFDPMRKLTRLDINSDRDVNELNAFYSQLAELPSRPGIITNHHAGKSGREGQSKLDQLARGSAAIVDSARSVLHVEKMPGGFRVEHLKFQDGTARPTFTVEAKITTRDEPWQWEVARFTKSDTRKANALESIPHIRELLASRPRLCSTEIRDALKGVPGLTPSGISDGLKAMEVGGEVGYEPVGKRKEWSLE